MRVGDRHPLDASERRIWVLRSPRQHGHDGRSEIAGDVVAENGDQAIVCAHNEDAGSGTSKENDMTSALVCKGKTFRRIDAVVGHDIIVARC